VISHFQLNTIRIRVVGLEQVLVIEVGVVHVLLVVELLDALVHERALLGHLLRVVQVALLVLLALEFVPDLFVALHDLTQFPVLLILHVLLILNFLIEHAF